MVAMSSASTGATPIVMTRLARLRSLLMNARRRSVRNCVHSSCQRIGKRRFLAGAAGNGAAGSLRSETCLTSWISRNASYLSRQNSGE